MSLTVAVAQPHGAKLHRAFGAVLVLEGEDSRPTGAGPDLREQLAHPLPVVGRHQEVVGAVARSLLRPISEQLFDFGTPRHDTPVAVEHHGRDL